MTQLTFDQPKLKAGGIEVSQPSSSLVHVEIAREKALNALIPETFHALHHVLETLTATADRFYLLFSGRGRAFSAGGDIRTLLRNFQSAGPPGSAARHAEAHRLLSNEYDLLARLSGLRGSAVVTVAVADGLAFGAGAGLFQACAVRLVTSRTVLAMPETKIGIVPDCGATRFFARLPGCVGMYAALVGARFSGGDLRALGLADGAVASGWRGERVSGGVSEADVLKEADDAAVGATATEICDAASALRRGVDRCFSHASFDEVDAAVRSAAADGEEWAQGAVKGLDGAAPRAMRETFEAMRKGYKAENETLRMAMDRELEADARLCSMWDFQEGVRAALIDKDNKPKWQALEE